MLFNSIEFLVFLPLVILSYSVLKSHRTTILLIASYFFYGWWNWSYLALIVFSTFVDYQCAISIASHSLNRKKKKLFLGISILSNLGLLGFFKYFNFFSQEANRLFDFLGMDYLIPYSSFILPMGISFYTFQTMAYTIEVYNNKITPERNPLIFSLYVSFFPQLVAGPIERPSHLITQLKRLNNLNSNNIKQGFYRIIFGLFKKLVIADRLALFVNEVYKSPENYDGSMLILATFFFAFQIYCDFSGYSDIAIGTARLFGIELMENFRMPYLATSIREFWSKWHISLSTWFRDYLYIPLGGNKTLHIRNIIIVFLVSGLWHGANWTFVIWGALHGSYFIIGNLFKRATENIKLKAFHSFQKVFIFLIVCLAWIFFRANNLNDAVLIVSKLNQINIGYIKDLWYQLAHGILHPNNLSTSFNLNFGELQFQLTIGDMLISIMVIPLLMVLEYYWITKKILVKPGVEALLYLLLAISVLLFGVFNESQFIYFQF